MKEQCPGLCTECGVQCRMPKDNHKFCLCPNQHNFPSERYRERPDRRALPSMAAKANDHLRAKAKELEATVGGKVGHDHPETSHVAAKKVRSGTQQAQVLKALLGRGPLTAYHAASFVLNGAGVPISANQTTTRFLELREQGYIRYLMHDTGKPIERETSPGNTAIVHELTPHGRVVATALR